MHRALIVTGFLLSTSACSAQSGWEDTTFRRHSIGVDVSAFIHQYGGVANSGSTFLSLSPYWVSYRYRLNRNCNLRVAVGGNYSGTNDPYPLDAAITIKHSTSTYSARVGVERAQELAKRWQFFYGLDLRATWNNQYDDHSGGTGGGYLNGREQRESLMGIAPLLGIRFRITPRFNLLTEASLSLLSTREELRTFKTPIDGGPEQPDVITETTGLHLGFSSPISITATFAL